MDIAGGEFDKVIENKRYRASLPLRVYFRVQGLAKQGSSLYSNVVKVDIIHVSRNGQEYKDIYEIN